VAVGTCANSAGKANGLNLGPGGYVAAIKAAQLGLRVSPTELDEYDALLNQFLLRRLASRSVVHWEERV
jgi:hypothetical protein